jgi:hypothetical protein
MKKHLTPFNLISKALSRITSLLMLVFLSGYCFGNLPGVVLTNIYGYSEFPPGINCSITGSENVCSEASDNTYSAPPGNLDYAWSISGDGTINGASNAQTVKVNAGASGSYELVLTTTDNSGYTSFCKKTVFIYDLPPCSICCFNEVCAFSSHGFKASVSPGVTGYKWEVSGNGTISGPSDQNVVVVNAGASGSFVLNLVLTYAGGCTSTCSRTVTISTPIAVLATNHVTCNGLSDGSISVSVNGGIPPYYFDWSDLPETSDPKDRINLGSGSYTLTVKDNLGCSSTSTKSIIEPPALTCSISVNSQPGCSGNQGSLTISANGGSPPYNYSWSNGGSGDTQNNLAPGNYTVTVTDSKGCSSTCNGSLSQSSPPTCSVSVIKDVSCAGGNDGSASVSGNHGTPPYTFSWSHGNTGTTQNSLSAGTYKVTVTDAKGCTSTCTVDIKQPYPLALNTAKNDPTCASNDGAITVSASGGSPPYQYSLNNINFQQGNIFTGLAAGTYTIYVKDSKNCSNSATATLTQPTNCGSDRCTYTIGYWGNHPNHVKSLVNAVGGKLLVAGYNLTPDCIDVIMPGPPLHKSNVVACGVIYSENRSILRQAIGLRLNILNDPALANLKVSQIACYSPALVPFSSLPLPVLLGQAESCAALTPDCPTASAFNEALTAINELFDECKPFKPCAGGNNAASNPNPPKEEETDYFDTEVLTVFPNPVYENFLQVDFYSNQEEDSYLHVYDMAGRRLLSFEFLVEKGSNRWFLDVSNLQNGMYILLLVNKRNHAERAKFVRFRDE